MHMKTEVKVVNSTKLTFKTSIEGCIENPVKSVQRQLQAQIKPDQYLEIEIKSFYNKSIVREVRECSVVLNYLFTSTDRYLTGGLWILYDFSVKKMFNFLISTPSRPRLVVWIISIKNTHKNKSKIARVN